MVIIIADDPQVTIDIDTKYLEYSPVLRVQMERWMKNGRIYMEDIDVNLLKNYINFLEGNDFSMNEEDEIFFDYMGHPNDLQYPLDYWKLKLKNRWIRENFYKYDLCRRNGGLYGLVELSPSRQIEKIGDLSIDDLDPTITIAGGAALYLSGYSPYFADIDLFPMNKQVGIDLAKTLRLDNISVATASGKSDVRYIDTMYPSIVFLQVKDIQLIKREYSCPSEIVHSFDIDATGFILVKMGGGHRLYATELALFSAMNKVIWLDPEFTEERYYWRLGKYIYKRFQLKVPFLSYENVDPTLIIESIQRSNATTMPRLGPIGKEGYFHQLMRLYRKTPVRDIPTDLGTFIILLSMFDLDIQSEHDFFGNMYAGNIIGPPNIPGLKFIDYGEGRPSTTSTINDWVERKRIILREPYQSKVSITGAIGLKETLGGSPLYIPDEGEEQVRYEEELYKY